MIRNPRAYLPPCSRDPQRILCDSNYPTLISTKGELVVDAEYLSLLQEMNVVVRFSAAGVSERFRPSIDRRCASFGKTLEKISTLTARKIATTLRIQPVIPGFEEDALRMTREAALAGAHQISFEYLKLPKESLRTDVRVMSGVIGFDILKHMKATGIAEQGWDYALVPQAKRNFIMTARKHCHESGLSFGAGDTEFIPWSDGDGCCGSASRYLHRSTQFRANYVGAIKSALSHPRKEVCFRSIEEVWSPNKPVSTYLDSGSRNGASDHPGSDWMRLIAARWNGRLGPYSPAFFDGVRWTGKVDALGFRIYDATDLASSLGATIGHARLASGTVTEANSSINLKASSRV
jgi:hypothetical protein